MNDFDRAFDLKEYSQRKRSLGELKLQNETFCHDEIAHFNGNFVTDMMKDPSFSFP